MSLEQISLAAATAVVGYNLMRDSDQRMSPRQRVLRKAGLKGSAAAGDTVVEIKVGTRLLARLYNSGTGFNNMDDMMDVSAIIPGGSEVDARVTDAPATNPINLALEFAP